MNYYISQIEIVRAELDFKDIARALVFKTEKVLEQPILVNDDNIDDAIVILSNNIIDVYVTIGYLASERHSADDVAVVKYLLNSKTTSKSRYEKKHLICNCDKCGGLKLNEIEVK